MGKLLSLKEATIALWGDYNETTRKRISRFIKDKKIEAVKDGNIYWIPADQPLLKGEMPRG